MSSYDAPLADRMRPRRLNEFVGQRQLLGPETLLRNALERDQLFSMIFWGPPGSGKTTLARLIAQETKAHFVSISAVLSGVKELRSVVEEAIACRDEEQRRTILFVDEVHRFNKAQQDAFLPHVETGLITLIGATTENPSFEIIPPLLSRCRVFVLHPYGPDELRLIVEAALRDPERGLGVGRYEIENAALDLIVTYADGDARMALNSLEAAASLVADRGGIITLSLVEEALQKNRSAMTNRGRSITTSFRPFTKVCVEVIPMRRSTGSHGC